MSVEEFKEYYLEYLSKRGYRDLTDVRTLLSNYLAVYNKIEDREEFKKWIRKMKRYYLT